MRIHAFMSNSLLLFAIASPALLPAQFQPPTDEELTMTAYPKAPGADAAYLNVEEITDDTRHFHRSYARIKVLAEKGKEVAAVEIPLPARRLQDRRQQAHFPLSCLGPTATGISSEPARLAARSRTAMRRDI